MTRKLQFADPAGKCRRRFGRLLFSILLSATPIPLAHAVTSPQELLAAGQVDEAIRNLEQQITQSPNGAEAYNLLCRADFMIEDWDHGISACERATKLDPQKSVYYLWLGRVAGEKADHVGFVSAASLVGKVRTSFERAVELDPRNWQARTDLAEFYLEAPAIVGGGKDKARQQANALLTINPAAGHLTLARIAAKEKDNVNAERECRAAIEASNSGARAWLDLAIFFRHTRRLDDMQEALRSMESSPLDYSESLMDGASLLLKSGRDFPLATRLLRRYLASPVEEGPAFKAHDMLGELLEKEGDRRAAADEYRAALELFHAYAAAQADLKRVER